MFSPYFVPVYTNSLFVLQTLSISMLLRYSRNQIFIFIGKVNFRFTKISCGREKRSKLLKSSAAPCLLSGKVQ